MMQPIKGIDSRTSGRRCAICPNSRRNFSGRFFKFPNEKNLLNMWCTNCKIESCEDSQKLIICQNHFKTKCFGKKNLKRNSIPTLLLPEWDNQDSIVYSFSHESESSHDLIAEDASKDLNLNENKNVIEESNRNKIQPSNMCDIPTLDTPNKSPSLDHNLPSTSNSHNIQPISNSQTLPSNGHNLPSKVDHHKLASTSTNIQRKKYKRRRDEKKEQNLLLRSFTEFLEENKTENDQYSALGQYVEHKLRSIPDELQKMFAEGIIIQAIQKATLKKLTETSIIGEPASARFIKKI